MMDQIRSLNLVHHFERCAAACFIFLQSKQKLVGSLFCSGTEFAK